MACPVPHPPCGAPKPDCERSVSGLFRDGRAVARRRGGAFLPIHGMPRPIHGMESRFHGVFPRFHGMFPADPWPVSCGKCGRLPHELPSPPLKTPQNAAAARSVGRRRRGKRRFVRSIWAARACRNFLENCPSRPLARCRCGQPCPAPCAARRRAAAEPAGGVCRFLTRAGLIICGKCLILQALKR